VLWASLRFSQELGTSNWEPRGARPWAAKHENSTNEPTDGQVAGNAQTILAITVKSETSAGAALDNVARFVRSGTKQGWSPIGM
jgi:hypothetical protein